MTPPPSHTDGDSCAEPMALPSKCLHSLGAPSLLFPDVLALGSLLVDTMGPLQGLGPSGEPHCGDRENILDLCLFLRFVCSWRPGGRLCCAQELECCSHVGSPRTFRAAPTPPSSSGLCGCPTRPVMRLLGVRAESSVLTGHSGTRGSPRDLGPSRTELQALAGLLFNAPVLSCRPPSTSNLHAPVLPETSSQ